MPLSDALVWGGLLNSWLQSLESKLRESLNCTP